MKSTMGVFVVVVANFRERLGGVRARCEGVGAQVRPSLDDGGVFRIRYKGHVTR